MNTYRASGSYRESGNIYREELYKVVVVAETVEDAIGIINSRYGDAEITSIKVRDRDVLIDEKEGEG